MERLKMESLDIAQQNIEKIAALFPSVITEMKDENGELRKGINFELLKRELTGDVVEGTEFYEFTWSGKKAAIVESLRPIRKTLRPRLLESKNWEDTENLYIEGDNLDVLKLLQESYLNSIRFIYIDPPYNTGNDFIYKDNFTMTMNDYEKELELFDEEGNRLYKNTERNGRFHSAWCTMIYPRLKLAYNLLTPDGVIFISIDENEVHNLRKICDEVFGEDNFLSQIVVKLRHENRILKGDKDFHEVCEYCLVYRKSKEYKQTKRLADNTSIDKYLYEIKLNGSPSEVSELDGKEVEVYSPDRYEVIKHKTASPDYLQWISVRGSLKEGNSSGRFYMKHLEGIEGKFGYLYKVPKIGKDKFNYRFFMRPPSEEHVNGVYFQGVPTDKKDVKFVPYPNFLDYVDVFNSVGYEGNVVFRNGKKPVKFIKHLMALGGAAEDKNCTVLDFFSGSASTAQATMELNAQDGGQRRFIIVQLPEKCDNNSEANKAGFKNICEIGKQRIRSSGEKIKEENKAKEYIRDLDIGFRVLRLDSTNMKDVYFAANEYNQSMLAELESNIKEDRSDLDLLYGVLLDWSLPLSLKHKIEEINGFTVHTVDEGSLIACFAEKISENVVREIAKRQPFRAVFKDSSFADSSGKINVEEIFKLQAPHTTVKVI